MVDVSHYTVAPTAKTWSLRNDLRFFNFIDRQKYWAGIPKPGHVYFLPA
jgi:hypothetical protein